MPRGVRHVEKGGFLLSGKVPVSGEKVLEKCHTNVTGKFRVGQQVNYMENVTTTKIRYEEASIESMVYYPGKNGASQGLALSDDLHEEWVIGEERPWWYFRL